MPTPAARSHIFRVDMACNCANYIKLVPYWPQDENTVLGRTWRTLTKQRTPSSMKRLNDGCHCLTRLISNGHRRQVESSKHPCSTNTGRPSRFSPLLSAIFASALKSLAIAVSSIQVEYRCISGCERQKPQPQR